ncbi:MAG: hypothetical protein ACO1G9_13600 [Bacteroidota bacterium]
MNYSYPSITGLVNLLLMGISDKYRYSQDNNTRITDALNIVKNELDAKFANGTLTNTREIAIRNGLSLFIPGFSSMIANQGASQQHLVQDSRTSRVVFDMKFLIGYIALSIWADSNNPSEFGLAAPFKDVNKEGSFYIPNPPPPSFTQCNHFSYFVILKATGRRMTKGESLTSQTFFGMMGAGIYFGNERDKSEAALTYLTAPTDTGGVFGDVISFSKDDAIHGAANNFTGGNHVGIYLGYDLYVSASGTGVSPFNGGNKSVALGNVPNHAHFCSVI